jgi:hypothetical protein
MQCQSCDRPLDPSVSVNLCCGTLCLDCFAVDMYTNETASCPTCRKGIPFHTDTPTRLAHAVNDVMRFFQLTPETLPLYNREEINGEKVDLIYIRLNLLKYDKRRVVVLGKRLKTETSEVERLRKVVEGLTKECETYREKLKSYQTEESDQDTESSSGSSDSDNAEQSTNELVSENDYEMWPDGSMRKVRRIYE